MTPAVIYSRVSSKDQEREGYSIPAQEKLNREYSRRGDFEILREFVDVETAKAAGRKQFEEMICFFRQNPHCRTVIVEKTDRLYRNFRDYVTLEDLDIEIHLVKEGQIISKDSKSQSKLIHGIQVVIARNYIENLREEVKKGMREKAEQGIYPSRPPLGYRNNKAEHTIEVDPDRAPIAQRLFELYGSGKHSLSTVRRSIKSEYGMVFSNGYLGRILRNPFYVGSFYWENRLYQGTQPHLISRELFAAVQDAFGGHNRSKQRKRHFAFSGILRCAYDDCMVTAELKKNRYTYYHCTGYRGKCQLPYMREGQVSERLGQILKDIHIPDDVLKALEKSLREDQRGSEANTKAERGRLEQRLSQIRGRIEKAYVDKLDGKISEDFWQSQSARWSQEESQVAMAIRGLEAVRPERVLDGVRILELANKAYFLYVRQNPEEQGKLLKMVLSNCKLDATNLYPTYRKPFDLIFEHTQRGEWRARRESNSRPSGS
jgi:site-specific DNA recombinase